MGTTNKIICNGCSGCDYNFCRGGRRMTTQEALTLKWKTEENIQDLLMKYYESTGFCPRKVVLDIVETAPFKSTASTFDIVDVKLEITL